MDLLNALLSAGGGGPIRQLAQNFGLDEQQATSAVSALLPALGKGLARNSSSPDGLGSLIGALSSNRHQRYLEEPDLLGRQETVLDGNGILGHILGSKDVSRQVASQASAQTGLSQDLLKKMLPVVATLAMGVLSRQNQHSAGAAPNLLGGQSGGLMGVLSSFLDQDGDGSAVDDVLGGLGARLFGK